MYNEKIEQLIKAALADGVLTEKEKQVLFKNAQAAGIDLDEFEMVLDARLVELQKAEEERRAKANPKTNPKPDTSVNFIKCVCGNMIPPTTKVCAYCGMVLNNDQKDIKEVLQIQDNFIKISEFEQKFPIGPIYLAALVIITFFNIAAWTYAIVCDDLVGLPVLSTIVWIAAIVAFVILEKSFTTFTEGNKYIGATKEHQKLLSTARAFYSQDKQTLNRIEEANNKVQELITANKKKQNIYLGISYGSIALSIIFTIILHFGWLNNALNRNSYDRCEAAIIEAIRNNDMEEAEDLYYEFERWNKTWLRDKVINGYMMNNRQEEAERFMLATEND